MLLLKLFKFVKKLMPENSDKIGNTIKWIFAILGWLLLIYWEQSNDWFTERGYSTIEEGVFIIIVSIFYWWVVSTISKVNN